MKSHLRTIAIMWELIYPHVLMIVTTEWLVTCDSYRATFPIRLAVIVIPITIGPLRSIMAFTGTRRDSLGVYMPRKPDDACPTSTGGHYTHWP